MRPVRSSNRRLGVAGGRDLGLGAFGLLQHPTHVGLTGTKPDIANQDVADDVIIDDKVPGVVLAGSGFKSARQRPYRRRSFGVSDRRS